MTPIEHEQVDIQPMTAKSRLTIIFTWTISVLVLVLYAWAIVNAVGNFVGLRGFARSLESDLTMSGWFWLLGGILLPIVIAVLAFSSHVNNQKNDGSFCLWGSHWSHCCSSMSNISYLSRHSSACEPRNNVTALSHSLISVTNVRAA